ncbi:4Fe-4S binding protein [bacterium]|nr:4Fe-4S dicluster domain-containing protein [bacterium]MBU3955769.1 4Fe-4S binding protein [bacterium]MBU4134658.1 4Fe-4S binding protein [bacterium]
MTKNRYLKNVATLKLDTEKCTGCGMCETVCPHSVFIFKEGKAIISDLDACMECGACALNCPAGALSVKSGVGCAAAVINAALGRTSSECCCCANEKESAKISLKKDSQ